MWSGVQPHCYWIPLYLGFRALLVTGIQRSSGSISTPSITCFAPRSRQMSGLIMSMRMCSIHIRRKKENQFCALSPTSLSPIVSCVVDWIVLHFCLQSRPHQESNIGGPVDYVLSENVYSVAGVQLRTIQERLSRRSEALVQAVGGLFFKNLYDKQIQYRNPFCMTLKHVMPLLMISFV